MDWSNTIKYRPVRARDIWSKKLLQKLSGLSNFKLAYTISGLWKFKTIQDWIAAFETTAKYWIAETKVQ